jgi:hypothetical protein
LALHRNGDCVDRWRDPGILLVGHRRPGPALQRADPPRRLQQRGLGALQPAAGVHQQDEQDDDGQKREEVEHVDPFSLRS